MTQAPDPDGAAPTTAPFTLEDAAETLQRMGFRAETVPWSGGGGRALRSAMAGAAFNLVPGSDGPGGMRDVALVSQFSLPLPLPDLPQQWNGQRRFARIHLRGDMLVLEMDVLLGDHGDAQLRLALELWNRLLDELVALLRERLAEHARALDPGINPLA